MSETSTGGPAGRPSRNGTNTTAKPLGGLRFPDLCEAYRCLPSEVQRFWDTLGKRSKLLVVPSQWSGFDFEAMARGIAQALADPLRAARERRIQMDVGDVHESHVPN